MIEIIKDILQSGAGQALIIAAITGIVAQVLSPRGKLVWAVSHQHHYRMPRLDASGHFPVVTQQVWFQNTGRSTIGDIEIVLNWKPQHFEIWDPREYNNVTLEDGRYILKFPSLNPQEFFTLSMIDTLNDIPAVLNVRWSGGRGVLVAMGPQRIFPRAFELTIVSLLFIGIVSILYFALQFIIHIST